MNRLISVVIAMVILDLCFIGCTSQTSSTQSEELGIKITSTSPSTTQQSQPSSSSSSPNTNTDTQTSNNENPITNTSPPPTTSAQFSEAQVIRVIDGDTIEVNLSGYVYTIRYIGIDTPETVHPSQPVEYMGKEASDKNKELVEGKVVRLEKDVSETDKYGRLLRYVYAGDLFVNAELVRLGYAQVSTYPPDVKYQDYFLELQREAQAAGRGLWATSTTTETPATTTIPTAVVNVQITKIFYDGLVPKTESDEYVEITNLGSEPVDLEGWVLKDISDGYPSFTFSSSILQPNQSIRVYTNEIHTEYGGFSFGRGTAIWNNSDPDTAALYNAEGQEVSRKSY